MDCIIYRRAKFSASHRYWLPELDEAENRQRFGLGANFPGHGHNYVLYVGMEGDIDKYGMVLNLSDVKKVIKREVTSQLDYSYLNDVWDEFKTVLPTTEALSKAIYDRLIPHLPVVSVQLFESPELWAEYQGNNMEATLSIKTHFSAAHRLALPELPLEENKEIYGLCARVNGHGHNYHLEITVAGEMDPRTGMIVDLGELEAAIDKHVVKPFDHTFLNKDVPYFAETVPTAENIAFYIAQLLQEPVAKLGAELDKVHLIESPNNSCTIYCRKPAATSQTVAEPALASV